MLYKLEDLKNRIKYAWQRATRGYDDLAVWNLNNWFLEYVPKILKDMNKGRCGHPGDLTDKQWDKIINKMIECFEEANEDTCKKENKYQAERDKMWKDFEKEFGVWGEKIPQPADIEPGMFRAYMPGDKEVGHKEWAALTKKYFAEEDKISAYRDKKLHEGLSLFDLYFWNLWD